MNDFMELVHRIQRLEAQMVYLHRYLPPECQSVGCREAAVVEVLANLPGGATVMVNVCGKHQGEL